MMTEWGVGVTREAFSLFWDAVVGTLFISQGGDLHLSSITPCRDIWKILGRILAFTLVVLGQFPSHCMSETLCRAILRLQPESDYENLVNDFLNSLGKQQQNLFSPLFRNENIGDLQRYIERGGGNFSTSLENDAWSTIINIARHTLLEIPSAAINAMQEGFFSISGSTFNGVTAELVSSWYREQSHPLFEEIRSRLRLESTEEGSERVFNVLIAFPRRHRANENLLSCFLRYCTGSTSTRGDSITVSVSSSAMAISHETCFLSMELPMMADDWEAEQAFTDQPSAELANVHEWTFQFWLIFLRWITPVLWDKLIQPELIQPNLAIISFIVQPPRFGCVKDL